MPKAEKHREKIPRLEVHPLRRVPSKERIRRLVRRPEAVQRRRQRAKARKRRSRKTRRDKRIETRKRIRIRLRQKIRIETRGETKRTRKGMRRRGREVGRRLARKQKTRTKIKHRIRAAAGLILETEIKTATGGATRGREVAAVVANVNAPVSGKVIVGAAAAALREIGTASAVVVTATVSVKKTGTSLAQQSLLNSLARTNLIPQPRNQAGHSLLLF